MVDANTAANLAAETAKHVVSDKEHLAFLWSAFGGCATLIIALVAILYNRLNKDIDGESKARVKGYEDIQAKLDRGISTFSLMSNQLVQISEQIKTLEEKDSHSLKDLEGHQDESKKLFKTIQDELKEFHQILLIIKIEHERCMARYKKREDV